MSRWRIWNSSKIKNWMKNLQHFWVIFGHFNGKQSVMQLNKVRDSVSNSSTLSCPRPKAFEEHLSSSRPTDPCVRHRLWYLPTTFLFKIMVLKRCKVWLILNHSYRIMLGQKTILNSIVKNKSNFKCFSHILLQRNMTGNGIQLNWKSTSVILR